MPDSRVEDNGSPTEAAEEPIHDEGTNLTGAEEGVAAPAQMAERADSDRAISADGEMDAVAGDASPAEDKEVGAAEDEPAASEEGQETAVADMASVTGEEKAPGDKVAPVLVAGAGMGDEGATPAKEEVTETDEGGGAPAGEEKVVKDESASMVEEGEVALAGEAGGVTATPAGAEAGQTGDQIDSGEARKRRRLLLVLASLLALLLCVSVLFWRYLRQPGPLPELLPLPADINYPPHYLFSIYGVDNPTGVALSPDGEWLYVTETGGERLVKIFDRDGDALHSFAPPRTSSTQRAPVYLAVDPKGRVLVTDRLQRVVFVYDGNGNYLDTILSPDLTLSEYVSAHTDGVEPDTTLAYNLFEHRVYYGQPAVFEHSLPAPDPTPWAPLGIRVDGQGNFLLTDVSPNRHTVREIPGEVTLANEWHDFDPPEIVFGSSGHGNGEFLFPNVAVADSQKRIYVTDGNNSRISVWDGTGEFLFSFGQGVGENALSLPRGTAMDGRDRLYVVDAVEQSVKVYDVSGPEPGFLFAFGEWGTGDGQFNYPNDIALDDTGRLYIADRENNRIQVWSY